VESVTEPADTKRAIWDAVDRLTKPRRQRLERAPEEWVNDPAPAYLTDPAGGISCSVAAYRAHREAHRAAVATWATIPSLWEQSTIALHGGEVQASGHGSKPLRERSIADLDLMEIRSLIRDTTRRELEQRNVPVPATRDRRQADFDPGEIRTLASKVIAEGNSTIAHATTDGLDWWRHRFEQWGRLLETYLRTAEHAARPVRLRNAPCPDCGTRQVRVDVDGEAVVVPAIVIDFRDGYIRAAECSACGAAWFRGPDLQALADALGVTVDTPTAGQLAG
jgi:hypothetical protein